VHKSTKQKMPSRKRNKGRDRKARQAENREANERIEMHRIWQAWARGDLTSGTITCDHGLLIPDDNNHPVCAFVDSYVFNAMRKNMANAPNLRETFITHAQVWNNDIYRKMATDVVIRMGTNLLLSNDGNTWLPIAYTVMVLENYDGSGDIDSTMNGRVVLSKMRDLDCGGSTRRDVLKFFRKRITCSCLKDMHLEARKTQPKTGVCYHCKERKERGLLMVCGRCGINQYCSRKCQMAHWPSHKCKCNCLGPQ